MPSYVKNTGLSSTSELFAMKKNLAYETKFEHQLSAMIKDFTHKKENLKQDIRMVYEDLQSIKLSTGYSLDKAKSSRSAIRRPSAPTIYLPPIGVRLVQKYIGVDVRRQSLIGENTPSTQQQTLDRILNQTIRVNNAGSKWKPNTTKKIEFVANRNENTIKAENQETSELRQENDKNYDDTIAITIDGVSESNKVLNPFLQRNERPLDDTIAFKHTDADATHHDDNVSDSHEVTHQEEVTNTVHDLDGLTQVPNENQEKIVLGTGYNLTERRSSRSTFRGRSSTRLPSKSNTLSEYNLGIIGHSKGKNSIKNFYLDYGDGKLHDIMEIPKVKDCARPWCNPHCKTCRNRTFSRPCFVLIPAEENVRKRQIPHDKGRPSIFKTYLPSHLKTQTGNTQNDDEYNESDPFISKDGLDKLETVKTKANDTSIENTKILNGMIGNKDCRKVEKDDVVNENTENSFCRSFEQKKKSYSRKRMNELSMPRGGPPAEVRFSKISLRKKQEQLMENERTKAFTAYEKENLTKIQGKISMFLALLNQQELMEKPVKMVDIPVRMDVVNRDVQTKKTVKRKWRRSVHFNSRQNLSS